MSLNFNGTEAFVFDCPTCDERYVGGRHDRDVKTAKWINLHGDWHSHGNKDAPPLSMRALMGL